MSEAGEDRVPLRAYTLSQLARLLQRFGFTVELGKGREAGRITGGSLLRPVLIPKPHKGRRLREDQVRYLFRELGIPVERR